MKIDGALVERPSTDFVLRSLELDAPRDDEVVVRVEAVGVCHTDLRVAVGDQLELPALLGHEGAGVVEQVGRAVTSVAPGDRVALCFASCGSCRRCQAGRPSYCQQFFLQNVSGARPDGSATVFADGAPVAASFFGQSSFATHALVRERNLVLLDGELPFPVAAAMACGVMTGAGTVENVFVPAVDESLLVVGAGAVGMAALMAAHARGLGDIVVVEPVPSRRELARWLGAREALDPRELGDGDDPSAVLREVGPFDYALDTTGRPDAIGLAFGALAELGKLALVAGAPGTIELPLTGFHGGRSVLGVTEGDAVPQRLLPQLALMWARGLFPVDELVTTYPLSEIDRAVGDASSGAVIKPVLLPGASVE